MGIAPTEGEIIIIEDGIVTFGGSVEIDEDHDTEKPFRLLMPMGASGIELRELLACLKRSNGAHGIPEYLTNFDNYIEDYLDDDGFAELTKGLKTMTEEDFIGGKATDGWFFIPLTTK